MAKSIFDRFSDVAKTVTDTVSNVVDSVESKYDLGTDGKLDMNDVVSMLLKSEGSLVDRKAFLQAAMENAYDQDVIDKALETSPADAGLTLDQLKELAGNVIKASMEGTTAKNTLQEAKGAIKDSTTEELSEKELEKLTEGAVEKAKDLISKAGGIANILTEDKFLKETLKAIQKLMYLYGVPEIKINESGTLADSTSRLYMLLGYAAMNGIEYAQDAIRALIKYRDKIADSITADKIIKLEVIEEIIKKWRKSFVTEKALMSAANSNPLVGKAAQKATYDKTFEPHCRNLIEALADTDITNSNHKPSKTELEILEAISKYF